MSVKHSPNISASSVALRRRQAKPPEGTARTLVPWLWDRSQTPRRWRSKTLAYVEIADALASEGCRSDRQPSLACRRLAQDQTIRASKLIWANWLRHVAHPSCH